MVQNENEGGELRLVRQEFNGSVGDVAGRDVVHNHGRSRPLTRDERRELNKLVKQLEVEFAQSGRETWTSIHRILGIDSIEGMHWEQYSPAEAILQLLIENAQLREFVTCGALNHPATNNAVQCQHHSDFSAEIRRLQVANASLAERIEGVSFELRRSQTSHAQAVDALQTAKQERQTFANRLSRLSSDYQIVEAQLKSRVLDVQQAVATRKEIAWMSIGIFTMAICAMTYVGYKAFGFRHDLQLAQAQVSGCVYDGKAYSDGSLVDGKGGRLRCVTGNGSPPSWKVASVARKTRSVS
ncbi:hypothetical protein AB3X91_03595 [Paraburkholderia sp. BR14263]|uniref:hypothetical protein n=1 Tax=unclassified Paraburkholderia TaxID=2615204 RepID=UPI0034CF8D7D